MKYYKKIYIDVIQNVSYLHKIYALKICTCENVTFAFRTNYCKIELNVNNSCALLLNIKI